jgi:hypothetical protein
VKLFAYIDPSSGSFVLQAAVGTLMGVSFAIRNRIKGLFSKFSKKGSQANRSNESE